MNHTPYHANKFLCHLKHIENISKAKVRKGQVLPPITVQIMPNNTCNYHCSYCSYGHGVKTNSDNKLFRNIEQFNKNDSIPWDKMEAILNSCKDFGVKGILIFGGGEPMLYKHIEKLLYLCKVHQFDTAMITNGTNINAQRATLLANTLIGLRISLDAGTPETYSFLKGVNKRAWFDILKSIETLVKEKNENLHLSIGFVVNNLNAAEIYTATKIVKKIGIDSIRLSLAFTNKKEEYFNPEKLKIAKQQIHNAKKDFESESFYVVDQLNDKIETLIKGHQQYNICAAQFLSTVIGADLNLYTCCMKAYTEIGKLGSLKNKDFKKVWVESFDNRNKYNPFISCQHECNYEKPNLLINDLINKDLVVNQSSHEFKVMHKNIL